MKHSLFFATVIFASCVAPTHGAADRSDGAAHVACHKAVFTAPPRDLPTNKMTDAPLLGNGDVAVAMGGPPNELQFFLGKSDLWGRLLSGATLSAKELADGATKYAHTKNGGRLSITIPALTGASYRVEQSLDTALTKGVFSQGNLVLRTTSRVDANRNLLITSVVCEGEPVEMTLNQSTPDSGAIPSWHAAMGTAHAGHEQGAGGRWGFRGEIADLAVIDHALDPAEVQRRASEPHGSGTKYDGKTWHPVETPKLTSEVTVSAWIKIDDQVTDKDVCYILSNGEWNQAYSLGLTKGRLRFALAGRTFDTSPVPVGQWIHVAGVADSKGTFVYVDGKQVIQSSATSALTCARDHGVLYGYRNGDPLPGCRRMAWATRVLGVPTEEVGTGLRVKLPPGKTATIITALASNSEAADPVAEARRQVAALNENDLSRMEQGHVAWWTDFWNKSFIEIPDKVVEKHWYGALYALASCSREGKLPPGLWGWATADTSAWNGSYTLNYNFEAPFFIAGPSNHPELLKSYFRPVMEFVPKARELAKARGWSGIYLPTGIAPWGWYYAERNFPAFADFGQRSNAVYAAVPFMSYWRLTHDERTLRQTVYPYLSGVAQFWEDYLKFENGRYVIYNDAIHEEGYNRLDHPVSQDMNPLVSLALVKQLFATVVPMSEVLGVDADKREKWRDIAAHISAFPTQPRNGKTVFRYTEKGKGWHGDNTLGVQHIYPGNGIGIGSDPKLLEIARNTIEAMNRWSDSNGTSTWYSACARVGYDPAVVLAKLRHECDTQGAPNLMLRYGGGGMENAGTFACVTEMLMQSHEGVLRFFPCWPSDQDARFGTLRADGAFLVSAELKGGVISDVKILSEKGRDCTVVNPWPSHSVRVTRNGKSAEIVSGERFVLKTATNETLTLAPL